MAKPFDRTLVRLARNEAELRQKLKDCGEDGLVLIDVGIEGDPRVRITARGSKAALKARRLLEDRGIEVTSAGYGSSKNLSRHVLVKGHDKKTVKRFLTLKESP